METMSKDESLRRAHCKGPMFTKISCYDNPSWSVVFNGTMFYVCKRCLREMSSLRVDFRSRKKL